MDQLEAILNYKFNNPELLQLALTHSSYANEVLKDPKQCNERLEFLGDAVLDMAVTNYLFNNCTDQPEGALTRLRASIVCERSLAEIGKAMGISHYMRFGHGEIISGGMDRDSIIADCMEAIIGAIYEDGGPEAANAYVLRHFTGAMEAAVHGRPPKDAKSMLQEILQKNGPARIHYSLVGESGPDHAKVFTMAVFKGDTELGRGTDRSKKSAEFRAAQDALNKLNQR